ncbi:MAG TPA: alpha/beta hydrolase-fold protein [Acidimicrobiales bacterium]
MRKSWLLIGCMGVVAAVTYLGDPASALSGSLSSSRPQLTTIAIPAPPGQIPAKWLGYAGPPRANVLLPADYDPGTRYPLLILLNALANNYDSYAEDGIVARLSGLDAIVVMPEGGSGWYADWWNEGERGSPGWESYELGTVIPTILASYPILPQRQYHAIAGFSMGGLGAVYLAGRLPGFFGTVASLSGFVDPGYFAPVTEVGMWATALAPFEGNGNLDAVYGPPNGFYAQGHDPVLLAANLQQTRIFESTGTGVPSSAGVKSLSVRDLGATAAVATGSALEAPIIYPMNQLYHRALTAAGDDVTYQVHAGGHDLPDFYNELTAVLAWGFFNPVTTDAASWINNTVATSGQLWDIGYRFAQPPSRVVRFQQTGSTLSISAAGSAVTVTTSGGCAISTPTPAAISLPSQACS